MGLCITLKVITAVDYRGLYTTSGYLKGERATGYLVLRTSSSSKLSDNGWITDIIGLRWLKEVFKPYLRRHSTGAKRLLILDSHSSHQTAEFDAFCKENAIICLCMPPHTSHLLNHWMLAFLVH
ncbi:hypothetical protein GB937_010024 [Aspergillus fischeri]|nr:hypothetical protein GB937_010024 [Aspergillus fischeri]